MYDAQGRGQHEAALDVLRTLSQAPDELPVPPTGMPLPGLTPLTPLPIRATVGA